MDKENKIVFITGDNEEAEFSVLEQTTIGGCNYLLVVDESDEDEAVAIIMKQVSDSEKDSSAFFADEEVIYEPVEDENEIAAVSLVFNELLEDYDLI